MPYNNTPIAPSNEVNGSVSLPLARVQKIIAADPDRLHVSKNASFAIALATEMFIQHLATTTHNVVKAERKPRRNIQYRDVASAVGKTDNLEFLADVVPKTVTYGVVRKKREEREREREEEERKRKEGKGKDGGVELGDAEVGKAVEEVRNGTSTASVGGDTPDAAKTEDEEPEKMDVDLDGREGRAAVIEAIPVAAPAPADPQPESEDEEDPAAMQIEMEMRGPRTNGTSPVVERRTSGFTAINGRR